MNCSQCGTLLGADAKFCHLCACPVTATPRNDSISNTSEAKWESLKSPFSVLLILLLTGFYAATILPAFGGVQFNSAQYGNSVLWMSVAGWAILWKRLRRRIWVGALLGFAASFTATVIASAIAALYG